MPKYYIVKKRARFKAICGDVNLCFGTRVEAHDNIIFTDDGKPLCGVFSQNAMDYFANDDDNMGIVRGKLIEAITKLLRVTSMSTANAVRDRWQIVWSDAICQKFRRKDHADFWVWNHEFFNASIPDLKYILNLLGGRKYV